MPNKYLSGDHIDSPYAREGGSICKKIALCWTALESKQTFLDIQAQIANSQNSESNYPEAGRIRGAVKVRNRDGEGYGVSAPSSNANRPGRSNDRRDSGTA
jgi:hypothetical protein